jgi:hypothetical protein
VFIPIAVNLMDKVDRLIETIRLLKEEGVGMSAGPTNSVGGGNIAGTPEADPGNPPVSRKKKKNIYLGLLSRTPWLNYIKKSKNK